MKKIYQTICTLLLLTSNIACIADTPPACPATANYPLTSAATSGPINWLAMSDVIDNNWLGVSVLTTDTNIQTRDDAIKLGTKIAATVTGTPILSKLNWGQTGYIYDCSYTIASIYSSKSETVDIFSKAYNISGTIVSSNINALAEIVRYQHNK